MDNRINRHIRAILALPHAPDAPAEIPGMDEWVERIAEAGSIAEAIRANRDHPDTLVLATEYLYDGNADKNPVVSRTQRDRINSLPGLMSVMGNKLLESQRGRLVETASSPDVVFELFEALRRQGMEAEDDDEVAMLDTLVDQLRTTLNLRLEAEAMRAANARLDPMTEPDARLDHLAETGDTAPRIAPEVARRHLQRGYNDAALQLRRMNNQRNRGVNPQ